MNLLQFVRVVAAQIDAHLGTERARELVEEHQTQLDRLATIQQSCAAIVQVAASVPLPNERFVEILAMACTPSARKIAHLFLSFFCDQVGEPLPKHRYEDSPILVASILAAFASYVDELAPQTRTQKAPSVAEVEDRKRDRIFAAWGRRMLQSRSVCEVTAVLHRYQDQAMQDELLTEIAVNALQQHVETPFEFDVFIAGYRSGFTPQKMN